MTVFGAWVGLMRGFMIWVFSFVTFELLGDEIFGLCWELDLELKTKEGVGLVNSFVENGMME